MPKQEIMLLLRQAASLGARHAQIGELGTNILFCSLHLIQILSANEGVQL